MSKNNNLSDFLKDIANAIRTKKGTTDLINAQDFRGEITSIGSAPLFVLAKEGDGNNDGNFYLQDLGINMFVGKPLKIVNSPVSTNILYMSEPIPGSSLLTGSTLYIYINDFPDGSFCMNPYESSVYDIEPSKLITVYNDVSWNNDTVRFNGFDANKKYVLIINGFDELTTKLQYVITELTNA